MQPGLSSDDSAWLQINLEPRQNSGDRLSKQNKQLSLTENLITAPTKYAPYPGNADLAYNAICKVLSERKDQVKWSTFTRDDWQMLVMMGKSEGVGPLLNWYLGKLGDWELDANQVVPEAVLALDTTEQETKSPFGVLHMHRGSARPPTNLPALEL